MKTNVTFRRLNTREDLHEAAVNAADGFEKYMDGIISTDVIFDNDNDKIVEFTVRVQGNTLVVKEKSDNFRKSLNEAADKMKRQIKKWKTRRYKN